MIDLEKLESPQSLDNETKLLIPAQMQIDYAHEEYLHDPTRPTDMNVKDTR